MGLYEAFKTKYTEEEIEDLLEILENRINILENTEQRIGTYNGKPLYRYIYIPATPIIFNKPSGLGWSYNIDWSLPPHIDTIVNMQCYSYNGPINEGLIQIQKDTSIVSYYLNPNIYYPIERIHLEYTKTTD